MVGVLSFPIKYIVDMCRGMMQGTMQGGLNTPLLILLQVTDLNVLQSMSK